MAHDIAINKTSKSFPKRTIHKNISINIILKIKSDCLKKKEKKKKKKKKTLSDSNLKYFD